MTPGEKALREAARIESARVYGKKSVEHRQAEPSATRVPFRRPDESYFGPAPAAVLVELVEAIVPTQAGPGPSRAPVEQSIARGLDDEQISALLDVEVDYVAGIRASMEKASA